MNGRVIAWTGIAALTISAAVVLAQPPASAGQGMPRYDKTTETTLAGTVEEVQSHQGRGGGTGTHLLLKTETGTIDVHVGPTNWLAGQKYEFATGDRLEVLGSKVTIDGVDGFIAREIKKGDVKMVLRDAAGIPYWSGAHRGTPRH